MGIEALMHGVRRHGDGDGRDGHFYRIETVMHVIDVMARVMEMMDNVIGIEAVMFAG